MEITGPPGFSSVIAGTSRGCIGAIRVSMITVGVSLFEPRVHAQGRAGAAEPGCKVELRVRLVLACFNAARRGKSHLAL